MILNLLKLKLTNGIMQYMTKASKSWPLIDSLQSFLYVGSTVCRHAGHLLHFETS
jgi:hypothetical protein